MAIGRSPNYPRITLEEALEKIKTVYGKQHTYPANKEVLAKNLGYGGVNGGSQAMTGALSAYGLLTKVNNDLKVSEEALNIIELPEDSPDRIETIKSLATAPEIFAELAENYPEKLPQNELIRHFLVKKKFLPKAADEVIRIYRANLEFVKGIDSTYNESKGASDSNESNNGKMQTQETNNIGTPPPPPPISKGASRVTIDITPNGEIQVSYAGEISMKTFALLDGIIKLKDKISPQDSVPPTNETENQENN